MVIKDCYTDYQPQDYNKLYDPFPSQPPLSQHVIDHKRLELDPDDSLPIWMSSPPVKNLVSLTLRYQAHQTSNANTRDTLRYGTCETLAQDFMMWGFETYQEFKDHLAVQDKAQVRDVWEEIKFELRNDNCRYLFWVPKDHQHTTRPGCWAITIDHDDYRSAIVWADQQIRGYPRLKLSKQNRIIVNQEPEK